MKRLDFAGLLLAGAALSPAWALESPKLGAPMGRAIVSVKVLFGLKDKKPTLWKGSYALTQGRIIATDGWRFMGGDYAGLDKFSFQTHRFFQLFWRLRGIKEEQAPMEPNGFILSLADLTPKAVLQVKTNRGDFKIPVGRLQYAAPQFALKGQVEFRRVPTSRLVVKAPTEDAYPAAASGPDGTLYVAYVEFTHGEGFRLRPAIKKPLEDFSFLAKPTGGDRIMFMEMKGGRWTKPVGLTPKGGDVFMPAIAVDGQGRVWVLWAANKPKNGRDNWDIFAAVRRAGRWSEPMRVSRGAGPDFFVAAAADSQGRVWAVWQSFAKTSFDILAARQEGDRFGEPAAVADSPANDWKPAIAASRDGRVAVAWDTYERGDYDVRVRIWSRGRWGRVRDAAASSLNETRPSLAFDPRGRLWVVYEENPEGWGKDFGPYDRSPRRKPLYRTRKIGVRVLAGEQWLTPKTDVSFAMPLPNGNRRRPKRNTHFLLAGPKVAVDASGRVYVTARVRMTRFISVVGTTWTTFFSTFDGDRWRLACWVPQSDGFLHEEPSLVPARGSGLYFVQASDGRFRKSVFFGPRMWRRRRRPKGAPPATTRRYPKYPDFWFNKEIAVADTGLLDSPKTEWELIPAPTPARRAPSAGAQAEARQVAAIRSYRAKLRGQTYRILRGEFHRHTELSADGGGDGTIFDMWRYALDMAALDWIGNGDHDNGGGREFTWWFTQKTISIFNAPGAFASMYSYERSCNYPDGHRNVVFARRGVRPLARLRGGMGKAMDDLPADAPRPHSPDTLNLYRYLKQFGGVCASHTSGTNMGTDWRDNDPQVEPIVEIYQGDRQNYERPGGPRSNSADFSIGGWRPLGFVSLALLKGYRLGFQASSDHISTHISYCNVWVREPTREAILEAMKARRIYGATDNIIADVRCGDHFMGEEFVSRARPTLRVKLIGSAPFAEVVIVKDNEYVYSAAPHRRVVEFEWTDREARPGQTSYYYVRGLQEGETTERRVGKKGKRARKRFNNGEIVWVSPMWITYQP